MGLFSTLRRAISPHHVIASVDIDFVQRQSHTEEFDVEDLLIIRRGITFCIHLKARSLSKLQEINSVTLEYKYQNDKHVVLTIISVDIGGQDGDIQVTIPAYAPAALYTLNIKGKFDDGLDFETKLDHEVVVLFNSWSRSDQVYLKDEVCRQEYVLNSNCRLYIGDLQGTSWNLALYRPSTLKVVIYMWEHLSKLTFEQRADPVLVSREMAALINVEDDNGILVNRSDGYYSDGKSPLFWTGSGDILEQFYRCDGKPVKYGQCWVFSGVLLTVLRVLGLPSRSVTNFNSAHDNDGNLAIDEYFTEKGERVDYSKSGCDFIWKFHVWNEVWMCRPDLPAGFGGWQMLDSSPIQKSSAGGGYTIGPCSLRAIKEGNSLPYDTQYVMTEVNADIRKYVIGKDGNPKLFQVDTTSVGMTISTKAVGTQQREDITSLYKYPEGSQKERGALMHMYKELQDENQKIEFSMPESQCEFGKDIMVEVKVLNKGKRCKICGKIVCHAVTYTGRVLGSIKSFEVDKVVEAQKDSIISVKVGSEAFTKFSGTKVCLKAEVTLRVVGTSKRFSQTTCLTLSQPKLIITGKRTVVLGEKAKYLIKFKNPLAVEVHNIVLNIDVDGMSEYDVVEHIGTVAASAEIKYVLPTTGIKLGKHFIVVSLASDKIDHVTGEYEIEVISQERGSLKPSLEDTPFDLDTLEVRSVELNKSSNQFAHHTVNYEYPGLVVRRGQGFSITITTSRPLPAGSKVVTRATFQMTSRNIVNRTSFQLDTISGSIRGNTIMLDLKPPADAGVGEYTLVLTVDESGSVSVLHQEIRVVILFNPWCKDDVCYYPNAYHLEEYVLNTGGIIWVGTATSNYGRPWQFSQFSKDSLDVALWIIDHMPTKDRGNAVLVARHLSAMTNVQDDNGILKGNWSGDFSGGTPPLKWTGSYAILKEFNTAKSPVSFGQCWVYSGVLTTLLRCVGLAARSVTNFNSAHDTHNNRAIDKYYDEDGNPVSSADSIWNFHVWNEAWMSRPDLPEGFGGWQVLDATPQEESPQGGGYRLGPSSCRAIKLGQRMDYDVEFVISEVNADVRYYTEHADGSLTLSNVDTYHVGKSITTKAIGSSQREDVTLNYKFAEGSDSERTSLLGITESEKHIDIRYELDHNIHIGQDISVTATVTNKASSRKSLKVRFYGKTILYTGTPAQVVKETSSLDPFQPGERKEYKLKVMYKDYLRNLQGGNCINFVCMAYDKENKRSVIKYDNLRLKVNDPIVAKATIDLDSV